MQAGVQAHRRMSASHDTVCCKALSLGELKVCKLCGLPFEALLRCVWFSSFPGRAHALEHLHSVVDVTQHSTLAAFFGRKRQTSTTPGLRHLESHGLAVLVGI